MQWHKKHTGRSFDMKHDFPWGYNSKELSPSAAPDASIYQKVISHTMALRDLHILKTVQQQLKDHDRVLVVFGASHYKWQKRALEHLFKKPVYHKAVQAQH